MRTKSLFKGSGCALVTPFKNGNPDFEAVKRITEYQIEGGTDAIIVCATTGEAPTLADDEHLKVIEYVVDAVNGRIPVIAGSGSNDTNHGINMSKDAEKLGVDGLLLVTPYYNKTTQRGLIKHYTAIADSVNIPVLLYNVPGRTGVNVAPQTLAVLAEHPNICGMKEASGNIGQVAEMISLCKDKIDFYSGNDDMNVSMASLGAVGTVSVLANIAPKQTHEMMQLALDGDFEKARKLQLDAIELIRALFCEVSPIPVKAAMKLLGLCESEVRLPLYDMAPENFEFLKKAMINYGFSVK